MSVPGGGVDGLIVALPKVELHVHLEGSMQPALLLELARKHDVPSLPRSLEAVRKWYAFRDFAHFIAVYESAVQALREEQDFAVLVEQTASALAAQNVRYAEVIFTPQIHLRRGVAAEAVFGGMERGRHAAQRRLGIQLRWIADFPGHWGVQSGEETLDAVLDAGVDAIIGFSVGGIEVDREPFAAVFARARAAGLHSVPHAGETHGADHIWSAIRHLGAERIGHGIRCLDDPDLVEHLRVTQLPLDVCPTSNWCTGAVAAGQPHPLPALRDAGLMITLNSDDPPMFATTLVDEYRAAHRMGLSFADLAQLARNGVQASFLDEPAKTALLADIDTIAGRARTALTDYLHKPSPHKPSPADRYAAGALGHERPTELRRLRLRERLIDPDTRAVLAGRGIQPGWRCLELGAGTGSIALWLADQCPDGQVVATDVDTRHLDGIGRPNLRVQRHDVVTEGFPAGSFDLIHARSLLANLPERDRVLSTMAGWLAPGGWLVVEDPCAVPLDSSPYPAYQRMMSAFEQYLARSHGADLRWPRRLPVRLAGAGLVDVGMRVFPQYVGDGGAGDALWRVALAQTRPGIVESGLLTEAEFTAGLALFDAPDFVDLATAMVCAWARRPPR